MTHHSKQERIEELLRKSLLGDELVNTQFHLFSARSSPAGRVLKPRVLCANNVLLAKSSKYFLDLLSSDINPTDPSLIDLTDDNDVPNNARIDDYGYGSDSDLEDCNDPIPITNPEAPKNKSASKEDDELSDDESVSSDMFVMSPEQPRTDEAFSVSRHAAGSVASSETAVQDTAGNKTSRNQTAVSMRLRSMGSRHVLVKDTAFQTWYTLLNYLYTDNFNFLPLSSATPGGQLRESSTSFLDKPRCSSKSMYRLASKVGLDYLRDEAFSYIESNLTEHNILKELSCSLVSRHPELLEMELDVLYDHIASPAVVADFPALARRIANKELVHGADIIVGIHTRLLKDPHPHLSRLKSVPLPRHFPWPHEPVKADVSASDAPEDEDEARPSPVNKLQRDPFALWGNPTPNAPLPQSSAGKARPNGGKMKANQPAPPATPTSVPIPTESVRLRLYDEKSAPQEARCDSPTPSLKFGGFKKANRD
ncbi:hypothetical protein OG21DRAFT_1490813 [Imleria badia]|nr:hypothetical protein OG21DRAFT_1490813 [Imleria badia]